VSHRFPRELSGQQERHSCSTERAPEQYSLLWARVRCSQRVGAGTFVGEGMNTLCPTGLAARNEAPVGTVLGGLGVVSNAIAI